MKKNILLTIVFLFSCLFAYSQRLNISRQLQKAPQDSMFVMTSIIDSTQYYISLNDFGQIVGFIGGTIDLTTVTDQDNGLDIFRSINDLTIAPDFLELISIGAIDQALDRLMIYDVSLGQHRYATINDIINNSSIHVDGNIWYVSENGNNLTAEVGKMDKPLADPWAARDSASNGDLIIILSGVYTFGDDVSADKQPVSAIDLSLMQKNLKYHFQPNTGIVNMGDSPYSLFDDLDVSQNIVITGNGKLIDVGAVSGNPVFMTENENSYLSVSLDTLSSIQYAYINNEGYADFKIKNYVFPSSNFVQGLISFRDLSNNITTSINLRIDNVLIQSGSRPGGLISNDCCGGLVVIDSSNIFVQADNVKIEDQSGEIGDVGYLVSIEHGAEYINSNVDFRFGNVFQKGTSADVLFEFPTSQYYIHRTAPRLFEVGAKLTNSNINIHCDNCDSDIPVTTLKASFGDGDSKGSTVKLTGNYRVRRHFGIIMDSGIVLPDSTHYFIDGKFVVDSVNVISDIRAASSGRWTFSGTFETLSDTSVVAAISQNNVSFIQAELINAGIVQPISANKELAVGIFSVFSNSMGIDSMITEIYQPIVRDTSVFSFIVPGFPVKVVLDGSEKLATYDEPGGNRAIRIQDIAEFTQCSPNDTSRVWYVSEGGSDNCQRGQIDCPCANPWQARDSATIGDVIFVLDGTYDINDFTVSDANLLSKSDISYYFYPSTRVIGNGESFEPLIENGRYEIAGYGSFENFLFKVRQDGTNIHFEGRSFDVSDDGSAGSPVFNIQPTDLLTDSLTNAVVNFRFKEISFIGNLNYVCVVEGVDSTVVNIDVDKLVFRDTSQDFNSVPGWAVWRIGRHTDSRLHITVDNSLVEYNMNGDLSGFVATPDYLGLLRGEYVRSQLDFDFGNVEIRSTQGYDNYVQYADKTQIGKHVVDMGSLYGLTLDSSQVRVNFGNVKTPNKLVNVHVDNAHGTSRGSTVSIHMENAESLFSQGISVYDFQGADNQLTFSGNYLTHQKSTVETINLAPVGTIRLNGRFRTNGAGLATCSLSHPILFWNSILVNDATVAPIISSVPLSVGCMNTFCNSVIIDANTTESIEPLLRDVLVK